MFYETADNRHGLAHDPFKAIVAPRPIGWIGTRGQDGSRNLAPYSFFNAIADRPKLVLFSSVGLKDTARNARDSGVFTASLVSLSLAEQMNTSSVDAPYGVDEFELAGLTPVPGRMVAADFVGEAFAALECRLTETFQPKDVDGRPSDNYVVIGQVVGIHIREDVIRDGRIDMAKAAPLARMGYMDYADGADHFEMFRPAWKG